MHGQHGEKNGLGMAEMLSGQKYLLCKHEDLSLNEGQLRWLRRQNF